MPAAERGAAEMAMVHLLDDPSPRVRLSLAEALAHSEKAPRAVVLSLAQDQPEIAGLVIFSSPVLTDADLVDLAAHGSEFTRILIASRGAVSVSVCAALAEIGGEEEVLCLLENAGASFTGGALRRIAERFGHLAEVRNLLAERAGLPPDARHVLVQQVSDALAASGLAQATLGSRRLEHVTREAAETATVALAGTAGQGDMPDLVEHLRRSGRLTPAFLMHALCSGKADFFAVAVANLSGCDERRVRAILATARMHAVRALFECAGLDRDISVIFVEATLHWRKASRAAAGRRPQDVSLRLLKGFARDRGLPEAARRLLEIVERLHVAQQRQSARDFAALATFAA